MAVSTDSLHSHLHWIRTPRNTGGLGQVHYPLAADFTKQMAKAYQVMVENEEDPMNGAALRAMFIIDEKQVSFLKR